MRPPMRKPGVPEELKSEITWGKARTRSSLLVHPTVPLWAEKEYLVHVIDRSHHIKNHEAKMTKNVSSEEKQARPSSLHSPSCPKHYRTVELQKLETFQEVNRADHSSHAHDELPAQKVGHDIACQAALMHNVQRPRKRKFKASAAHDNHKICIRMGFSCGIHHREEKKQLVNKTLLDQSSVLDECQKGLEQIQLAECLLDMTNHPLAVEERSAFSETKDQINRVEPTTDKNVQLREAAHLNPIWFTFMSKRRVVTKVERREAKTAARRYSKTLRRPNCMAVMEESHVSKEFIMGLPNALVLLGDDHVVFPQAALTLVDSIGRAWEMQWFATDRHRLALVPKDWALFAVHHFLEEGDACVFEATDIQALTILVRIFRVVDIPDNLGTDSIYTHYSVEPAL